VKDNRVLVPVVVIATADGGRRVRYGHRRTQAAIDGGPARDQRSCENWR
jgi:hypothetical protein